MVCILLLFLLTTKVESLRSGYRIVPLFDDLENPIPLCNLFVHVTFHQTANIVATEGNTENDKP